MEFSTTNKALVNNEASPKELSDILDSIIRIRMNPKRYHTDPRGMGYWGAKSYMGRVADDHIGRGDDETAMLIVDNYIYYSKN